MASSTPSTGTLERYTAYDKFAQVYDRYWAETFAKDLRPILGEHFLPVIPRSGAVLDLCCGTGQIAKWLSDLGFRVTGVDGSSEMLAVARERAPSVEYILADARQFRVTEPCSAALSTFDSLNHLPSTADLAAVFRNVHAALRPDGLFLFDMNMEEGFIASSGDEQTIADDGVVCLVESTYDRRTGVGVSEITIFRGKDGGWARTDFTIHEYCYSEGAVREQLLRAGFQSVATFDAVKDFGMRRAKGRKFFLAAMADLPPGL